MSRWLKNLIYAALFPLYSLFSKRTGFAVFFPGAGGWWVYTRGVTIKVREPRIWVLEYYRRFVPRQGGVVFDIGGEFGYETEQFSKMVGPTGHVWVFECLPDHVRHLQSIASRRPNVTVLSVACWNARTELEFFTGHTPGSNTAVKDAIGQRGQALADPLGKKYVVCADTLGELWKHHAESATIDFLKMDIEGAEYEALEGADEMLPHVRHAVIAAYHIRNGQRTAARVAQMLEAAGFQVEIGDNYHVYASRLE